MILVSRLRPYLLLAILSVLIALDTFEPSLYKSPLFKPPTLPGGAWIAKEWRHEAEVALDWERFAARYGIPGLTRALDKSLASRAGIVRQVDLSTLPVLPGIPGLAIPKEMK